MLTKWLILGVAGAALGFASWAMVLQLDNGRLRAEVLKLQADLLTCSARIKNIQEDIERDETVSDPRVFDVPDHWLLPPEPDG